MKTNEMETIYVKVKCSDRLPNKEDHYITDAGELIFSTEEESFYMEFMDDEYLGLVEPEYWIESRKLPKEDEIVQLATQHANKSQFLSDFPHDWNSEYHGYVTALKDLISLFN